MTPKTTKFILVREQEKKEGIPVEFSKTQHCEICDRIGSYWIADNYCICRPCIVGLAKLLK